MTARSNPLQGYIKDADIFISILSAPNQLDFNWPAYGIVLQSSSNIFILCNTFPAFNQSNIIQLRLHVMHFTRIQLSSLYFWIINTRKVSMSRKSSEFHKKKYIYISVGPSTFNQITLLTVHCIKMFPSLICSDSNLYQWPVHHSALISLLLHLQLSSHCSPPDRDTFQAVAAHQ